MWKQMNESLKIGSTTIARKTIRRTTIGRSQLVATTIARYENWSNAKLVEYVRSSYILTQCYR